MVPHSALLWCDCRGKAPHKPLSLLCLVDMARSGGRHGWISGCRSSIRGVFRAGLDGLPLVRDFYRMKATTMTLSEKRQSVFPQDWCERVGLARGGPVNVFDLGEVGLLIRPVRPPTPQELEAALAAARPRRSRLGQAERIVAAALKKIREQA
jgi:hypothetical protein